MACFGTDASGQCLTNIVLSDPSGRFCSWAAKSGLKAQAVPENPDRRGLQAFK